MNLRRRVERIERIVASLHATPVCDSVVAILLAGRLRSASLTRDQLVHEPPSDNPEELRRKARQLRQKQDAQLKIALALRPNRR